MSVGSLWCSVEEVRGTYTIQQVIAVSQSETDMTQLSGLLIYLLSIIIANGYSTSSPCEPLYFIPFGSAGKHL